jgi:carbon-monoxide dehydrogenase medium subunit
MLHHFVYEAPRDRAELLARLAEYGARAKILAGGTDLLPGIRGGQAKPELVLDVKRIPGYGGVAWDPAVGLSFGPATTVNDLLRDARVRGEYPLLAACAHDLASYQIRNRATVIGNVVNASPCSDMAPGLLCLDAKAVIVSAAGERTVAFRDFFTGVKRTVLKADELLERIVVPAASAGVRGDYRKLKRINGHDLGIVGVAVARTGGRREGELRVAVSSAAPTPVLVAGLDAAAAARPGGADAVVAAVLAAINPISDVRCTREYRLFMVETFVRRLLEAKE